jgi:putative acetyltransferase
VSRLAPTLRPYRPSDEDAAIDLWLKSWQATMPQIDFAARVSWWRRRWREELVPTTQIVVAYDDAKLVGFVTVDPDTRYLDQIVVAPDAWGGGFAVMVLDAARARSPTGLDLLVNKDNLRAIRFYEKHGFRYDGEDVNPTSGRPVNRMVWRPA